MEVVRVAEPSAHLFAAVEFYGPGIQALQLAWDDDRGNRCQYGIEDYLDGSLLKRGALRLRRLLSARVSERLVVLDGLAVGAGGAGGSVG